MLQKLMLLVAVGSMVISMGCVSFATSGGDLSDREIVPNYTGVSNVVSHLISVLLYLSSLLLYQFVFHSCKLLRYTSHGIFPSSAGRKNDCNCTRLRIS